MMGTEDEIPRAVVPANVNEPDKITFGLTFRQLAIIGGPVLGGIGLYCAFGALLPVAVWIVAGLVVLAASIVVALGRRDGLPLDEWLLHGLALANGPKTLTPGSARESRVAATVETLAVPAPLRTPVTMIGPNGVLISEGKPRVLIACGTTNIHLRTGGEQAALLDGFGRFLNALAGPAQIIVSAHRHDLAGYAHAVAERAPRLPHPELRRDAVRSAVFLLDLDAEREPLRRQVLTVVTGEHITDSAVRALSGLGVEAVALDGPAVTAALAAAVDPFSPPVPGPRAVPGIPITLRSMP